MEHLQSEGVRGADLVFACIGPASRYSGTPKTEVYCLALTACWGLLEGRTQRLSHSPFLWTLQSTDVESKNGHAENR